MTRRSVNWIRSETRDSAENVNLRERLEWLRLHLGDDSYGAFSKRMGWKRGHYSALVGRLEKLPAAGIDARTAQHIAEVSGVDLTWLLQGRGQPFPGVTAALPTRTETRTVEYAERYPNRTVALRLFANVFSKDVLEALKTVELKPTDVETQDTVEKWRERAEKFHEQLELAKKNTATPVVTPPDPEADALMEKPRPAELVPPKRRKKAS